MTKGSEMRRNSGSNDEGMEQTMCALLGGREQRAKSEKSTADSFVAHADGKIGVEISETQGPWSFLGFLGGRFKDDSGPPSG